MTLKALAISQKKKKNARETFLRSILKYVIKTQRL
jgi:hypothetical protein